MWFPAPRQWGQVNRFFSDTSLWAGPFSTNLGITTGPAVTSFNVKGPCPTRVSYSKWFSPAHFIYPEYFSWKAVCTGERKRPGCWGCGVSWWGAGPLGAPQPDPLKSGKVSVCTTSFIRKQHPALAQNTVRGNLRLSVTDLFHFLFR